jgi:hypothetical protein
VTDSEPRKRDTDPGETAPDADPDEVEPAFDIDLEPDEQGTAEAGEEPTG